MILCDFGYIPHCGPAFSVVRNGERIFVCTIDCCLRISEDCRYLRSSLESIHFGEAV